MRTIRCPECGKRFVGSDNIVMSLMNTLNHKECSNFHPKVILDEGTYKGITDKYSFFKDYRIVN
ncbi:hypothetical protein ACFFIX_06705 [Metabacillus herbersteinensis]|uniref:C2H2-type domain-containing protein n=1 Tax=Metabacillus herbersteinensis TaxID=283816 RepID=A0ABV6GBT8_9BACI